MQYSPCIGDVAYVLETAYNIYRRVNDNAHINKLEELRSEVEFVAQELQELQQSNDGSATRALVRHAGSVFKDLDRFLQSHNIGSRRKTSRRDKLKSAARMATTDDAKVQEFREQLNNIMVKMTLLNSKKSEPNPRLRVLDRETRITARGGPEVKRREEPRYRHNSSTSDLSDKSSETFIASQAGTGNDSYNSISWHQTNEPPQNRTHEDRPVQHVGQCRIQPLAAAAAAAPTAGMWRRQPDGTPLPWGGVVPTRLPSATSPVTYPMPQSQYNYTTPTSFHPNSCTHSRNVYNFSGPPPTCVSHPHAASQQPRPKPFMHFGAPQPIINGRGTHTVNLDRKSSTSAKPMTVDRDSAVYEDVVSEYDEEMGAYKVKRLVKMRCT